MSWRAVQRRISHGAEEHCVGLRNGITGGGWEGGTVPGKSRCADGVLHEDEPIAEQISNGGQNPKRLGGDLGPDPVAREHRDLVSGHDNRPGPASRRLSNAEISRSSSNVLPISSSPRSSISRRYPSISNRASNPLTPVTRWRSRSTVSS